MADQVLDTMSIEAPAMRRRVSYSRAFGGLLLRDLYVLRRELGRGIVFHVATNTVPSIVLYLSCLELGCPVALLEPGPSNRLERLLQAFDPDAIVLPQEAEMPASATPAALLPDGAYKISLRGAARATLRAIRTRARSPWR